MSHGGVKIVIMVKMAKEVKIARKWKGAMAHVISVVMFYVH